MKYCPTCDTRYDEEILRFCMKDGTPLIDEAEPAFIQMPSESIELPDDDEPGEVTVIRTGSSPAAVPPPPPQNLIDEISFSPDAPAEQPSRERIVVTTEDEQPRVQPRARVIPPYQPPPQPPNTAKVVVLTIIGTIAAMALGAFGFWFLQNDRPVENLNVNTNFNNSLENTNVNTNLGFDSNFNFNMNANFNANSLPNINANANANLRTPTPTPKPSPSPTATPSPTPDDEPSPSATPTRPPAASPSPMVIRPGQTPPSMRPLPSNRPNTNRLDG